MSQERRCPTCGALVSADAAWCGQCYAPLEPREAERSAAGAVAGKLEMRDGRLTWTCPVCGERNPIEGTACGVCDTPFTRLFAEPDAAPSLDPQTAAAWSLAFPGLGHWKAGRRSDAVARMVLFAWTFGALAVLLVARFGKGGLGSTFPLFLLFLLAAAAVYVVSAIDAYRVAAGDEPLVSSRTLLWSSAALVVLSVLIASFVTLPAARR
ncbi:MAG TPA: zinc ribbon domain-containing protein [Actinomycetota bacterium]